MNIIDTHCHIHSADYSIAVEVVDADCRQAGVDGLICIGTDVDDSQRAVQFAQDRPNTWAAIGVHPHEAKYGQPEFDRLRSLANARDPKVVAIGECGLDYFYGHSTPSEQETALRYQIELALEYDLPLVFHVREAFDDFWPILNDYQGIRGVVHSFTDTQQHADEAISRGLYIGVNGITTFTKNDWQLEVVCRIPLEFMLLETDAPFLTPAPLRGKVNEPAYVSHTAAFVSKLRDMPILELTEHTTANAKRLFSL